MNKTARSAQRLLLGQNAMSYLYQAIRRADVSMLKCHMEIRYPDGTWVRWPIRSWKDARTVRRILTEARGLVAMVFPAED